MTEQLGERLLIAAFSICGDVNVRMAQFLVRHVMAEIGVSAIHEQAFYSYPESGKGGNGFTLIQPIAESFLAIDAWPDHGGAYLVISSCKDFDPSSVIKVIQHAGLKVTGTIHEALSLKHPQS